MVAQHDPFLIGRGALLAQNLSRYGELSDVVQQCPPSQPIDVFLTKPELSADDLGVRTNPFGVPTGEPFVLAECHNHRDSLFG